MAAPPVARALLLLTLLSGAVASRGGPPYGHPSPTAEYPSYPGFTLWLVEEFEKPLDLDADPIWTWSDGGLTEGQVRFTREAIKFENGKMVIEAASSAEAAAPPQACSAAEKGVVALKNFTSGELRTRHNMFRYGMYEVRMRAPSVRPGDTEINGNYISTMFAYRDAKFKHWREIDIEVTGDTPDSVTMNVLSAENTAQWSPDIQANQRYNAKGANVRRDFHTYAFDWRPQGITWYFDGKMIGRHSRGDEVPVPDLSTKIMMNLWIFNTLYDFGGRAGANNRYPMRSEYEWFRFWKWDGDRQYPCADMGTSCLTADDRYLSKNNPCDGIEQVGDVYGNPPCQTACGQAEAHAAGAMLGNGTQAVKYAQWLFP